MAVNKTLNFRRATHNISQKRTNKKYTNETMNKIKSERDNTHTHSHTGEKKNIESS